MPRTNHLLTTVLTIIHTLGNTPNHPRPTLFSSLGSGDVHTNLYLNSPPYTKEKELLVVALRTCFTRHGRERPPNWLRSYLTEKGDALLMSLASRAVLALAFSLKREPHSALSRFEFPGPRRNLCLSPTCPPWVWGEFTFWTTLSPLWRSHSREGGVLLRTIPPSLETSSPGRKLITNIVLAV